MTPEYVSSSKPRFISSFRTTPNLTQPNLEGKNRLMSREQVIATLRQHEPELQAAGVVSLSVFGSAARDDGGPDSDVDIAVRLVDNFSCGGFDYFARLEALERRLSSMLDCKVDLVEEPVSKERFQRRIDKDRVLAF